MNYSEMKLRMFYIYILREFLHTQTKNFFLSHVIIAIEMSVDNMIITDMELLLKQHAPNLFRYAYMLAHTQEKAEELVQLSFIKLWQKQDQIKDEQAIRAWLHTVCLNEYHMQMRKKTNSHIDELALLEELEQQGKLLQEDTIEILDELIAEEEVAELRNGCFHAMANKLTLQQRIAFSLVDMYGLSIHEAGLLLDVSDAALKGLLYRARMNLSSFFASHCPYISKHGTCRCVSWKSFVMEREHTQKQIKTVFSSLEFQELGYEEQDDIRKRLLYYYQRMPSILPSKQWYEKIMKILKL